MGLNYANLNEQTRQLMLEEVDYSIAGTDGNTLYRSDNLSEHGKVEYPSLLKAAARSGTDDSLAEEIRLRLNSHEKPRSLPSGGFSKAPVMRSNAHTMLAEGEFNRFYIRAVCRRAIQDGVTDVTVYRARASASPRPESEAKIGMKLDANDLLRELRSSHVRNFEAVIGIPAPNSGLSVRL